MGHVLRDEAGACLEGTVKDFEWAKEFLGGEEGVNLFLSMYRIYHSQLREGDKLDMKIQPGLHNPERCPELDLLYPVFEIVLNSPDSESRVVYSQDSRATNEARMGLVKPPLLYSD